MKEEVKIYVAIFERIKEIERVIAKYRAGYCFSEDECNKCSETIYMLEALTYSYIYANNTSKDTRDTLLYIFKEALGKVNIITKDSKYAYITDRYYRDYKSSEAEGMLYSFKNQFQLAYR
jgi:hypothetical protein